LTTKRFATAVTVALVLFVTAIVPAAAVCCFGQPAGTMASMQSMPCCAETCTMSNPGTSRDNDPAVAATPAPEIAAGPGVAAVFPSTAATITTVSAATEQTRNEYSAPPPFLAHAQFRI
jgi:hypothetical protein